MYECGVCKTRFPSKTSAQRCEKLPIEKKEFKIGNSVTNVSAFGLASEPRKPLYFTGKVIGFILRPDHIVETPRHRVLYTISFPRWGVRDMYAHHIRLVNRQ